MFGVFRTSQRLISIYGRTIWVLAALAGASWSIPKNPTSAGRTIAKSMYLTCGERSADNYTLWMGSGVILTQLALRKDLEISIPRRS
jgi:hypothetical protein